MSAWIEIKSLEKSVLILDVALPVSAWIEINFRKYFQGHRLVALPVSAWIEISQLEASIPLK